MRLREVLELDVVRKAKPEVLAGADLLEREVRWVHTSELAEAAELLKGGELLLTTGLGLAGRGPVAEVAYIGSLAAHNAAAVAFELGWTFNSVPEAMVDAARRAGLPLIVLRNVVPFVEITEAVQSGLLNDKYTQLRLDSDVDRILQGRLLQGRGLQTLVSDLHQLLACAVVLETAAGQIVAGAGLPADVGARRMLESVGSERVAIQIRSRNWGWLHLLDTRQEDTTLVRAVLRRAPAAIALALIRDEHSRSLEAGMSNEFLTELVTGRVGTRGDVAAQAGLINFDVPADGPFVGIAIQGSSPDQNAMTTRAARHALSRRRGVIGEVDDIVLGLIDARRLTDAQQFADSLHEEISTMLRKHRLDSRTQVVVGPTVIGLETAGMSLREAQSTLSLCAKLRSSGAVTSRGMAADRLLGRLLDDPMLTAIIEEQIGELLKHDERYQGQLAQTLWAYLASGSGKTETADALHIRRQSLYKRLTRIRELIGDIDDPQRCLPLLMALRAHSLLTSRR